MMEIKNIEIDLKNQSKITQDLYQEVENQKKIIKQIEIDMKLWKMFTRLHKIETDMISLQKEKNNLEIFQKNKEIIELYNKINILNESRTLEEEIEYVNQKMLDNLKEKLEISHKIKTELQNHKGDIEFWLKDKKLYYLDDYFSEYLYEIEASLKWCKNNLMDLKEKLINSIKDELYLMKNIELVKSKSYDLYDELLEIRTQLISKDNLENAYEFSNEIKQLKERKACIKYKLEVRRLELSEKIQKDLVQKFFS